MSLENSRRFKSKCDRRRWTNPEANNHLFYLQFSVKRFKSCHLSPSLHTLSLTEQNRQSLFQRDPLYCGLCDEVKCNKFSGANGGVGVSLIQPCFWANFDSYVSLVRMEENGMKTKLEIKLVKDENPVESVTKNSPTDELITLTSNSADELLSLTLPTQTRSNKRKHIRTDFDEIKVSSDAAEAQRRERERLERLSKIYESEVSNLVEPQCKERLNADGHPFVKLEPVSKHLKTSSLPDVKPSTSFVNDDIIELSSDEDSNIDCRPLDLIQPLPLRRRSPLYREELESKKLMGGRLLVNPGKASDEPDVYVPFHLNDVLQPHQLGGIRFMYGNIIESMKDYAKSPGFGCILAHAMGLGKTIQIITFTDIFVRTTNAKNRVTEAGENIRPFVVWLLSDAVKTNEQRAELIQKWHTNGGILLIGYDMFRLLVQIKPKKRIPGKHNKKTEEIVDLEKEELDAIALCAAREALLDPGPDLVVCDEGHRIKMKEQA
ncbi:Helicase ARIP4 [Dirofilaria immitis]|nr:Helicase ARIP4 [Dirofilaria immitis]